MAHPEPRNLNDIYGPGAENADAGDGGPDDRIKSAKESLRRAEYLYESAGDDSAAIGAAMPSPR